MRGIYDVETLRNEVKQTTWRNVLVVRRAESLSETLKKLLRYREIISSWLSVDEEHIVNAFELKNMIEVGLVITKSAITRNEIRGSHYRADYPQRNDKEWLKMIEVQYDDGNLQLHIRKPNMIIKPKIIN